jgi:hypothetical protein
MGGAKETIRKELLELEPRERAEVAEDAIRSLAETSYGELTPAWEREIQERLRAVEDGSAEVILAGDVFRELEAELGRGRQSGLTH